MPALVPLLFSAIVYRPILDNYFYTDDFGHLYNLANNGVGEFLLTPHGGHLLFVRNLIFCAFYKLFGLDPFPYLLSVFVTHLANVCLLYLVIVRLTQSVRLAIFGATLWGVCPLDEGSLGWYSVYGHVLAGTIFLWVLCDVLGVTRHRQVPSGWRLAGWWLLLIAGATCFGVGLAVAMTFPAVVFLLLPASPARARTVRATLALVIVIPILFVTLHRVYLAISGGAADASVVPYLQLFNWQFTGEMLVQLLRYGAGCLALPYVAGGTSDPCVLCGWVGTLCLAGIALVLLRAPVLHKRRLLAFVLTAVATYALIAAGRATFYLAFGKSVVLAATESRYHYVGLLSIAIVFCLLLNDLGRVAPLGAWRGNVLLVGWLGAVVFCFVRYHQPIDAHAAARQETQSVLATIDKLAKATRDRQPLYIHNYVFRSIGWSPAHNFPGWAGVFLIAYPERLVNGLPVYFVETDPDILAAARSRPDRPINTILLSPGQVQALSSPGS